MHEDTDESRPSSWPNAQMYVMRTLDTHADGIDAANARIDDHLLDDRVRFERLSNEITSLKVKATILGALGGAVLGWLVNHFSKTP